ncbi:MAG: hypothetical protein JNK12_17075 [Acidimicrobiales bacterium]|nr:hypothetical protein [Acidimicrobiales bacterium]
MATRPGVVVPGLDPEFVRGVDPARPVPTLDDHVAAGGGAGLDAARRAGGDAVLGALAASGLRGRGGAGFPTATKWATVAANRSADLSATVVVNAAEGEPGTFKDRAILRANPFAVLEGALVAAGVVGADTVVVAAKASFSEELARVRSAIAEVRAAGWADGVALEVVEGPAAYLFGEETGLLEVLGGRGPFPRVAPPYRHGLDTPMDAHSSGRVPMAGTGERTAAAPTLVNNVETFANVAGIVLEGPDWYRDVGTPESPGTVVCTVTGAADRHGVGAFPMGTPLRVVLDTIGGDGTADRAVAVLSGVANPLLPADRLDTPVSFEGLAGAGAGLGSAGFVVFDERDDLAAVAEGVSRFLAVESCGQCTPCKEDGLAIADTLLRVRTSAATELDLVALADRTATVGLEARCSLASQHQVVVESVLRHFPGALDAHVHGDAPGGEPYPVAPLAGFDDEGRAVLDGAQERKRPDWTVGSDPWAPGDEWSGEFPAASGAAEGIGLEG